MREVLCLFCGVKFFFKMSDSDINSGDLITVTYEERKFTAIVIDSDGLGQVSLEWASVS
jgi:hypothetical protein